MGEDLARRQTVARLTRLCETAMRLLDDQASPTIIASSSSASCNWRWDANVRSPSIGRGTVRLRLSRHGGTHHLSVHEGDSVKPLTRITEDERLAPIVPVTPSRESMLATIRRMRDALAADGTKSTGDLARIYTALAMVAHPTAEIVRIVGGGGNGGISIMTYDRDGTTMRRWAHPAIAGWGTFSAAALVAIEDAGPSPAWLMIDSGGLSGRSRKTHCRIMPCESADGDEPDPLEILRTIGDLPEGAMLLPPAGTP